MKTGSTFKGGKFRNNHSHDRHSSVDALKWLWGARKEFREFEKLSLPLAKNDPAFLKANRSAPTLTWIGHASFLLQLGGLNVVTDPVFSRRVSPLPFAGPERLTPLGLTLKDLPPLELALISHNHYDHLDEAAVKALARQHPQLHFLVPLGLKRWFERRGITQVTELDWWQDTTLQGAKITAVPAQHFSGRSVHDRNATLWCGFVLETAGRKVFFAGDTGYSKDFAAIGQAFAPIDLALLPIGAYAPRWFMQAMHINPEEAVQIFRDVGAVQAAAMHWGTFRLTLEAMDEPPRKLAEALAAAEIAAEAFYPMQHGETRQLVWP